MGTRFFRPAWAALNLFLAAVLPAPFAGAADSGASLPLTYTAYRTERPVTIDGQGNESAWNDAVTINGFVDIRGPDAPEPAYATRVRLLWDDSNVYVLAQLEEPHVWGDITQRDGIIYNNNAFEMFIRPDASRTTYVEFEVNALGTLWDLQLDRPYRDGGQADSEWDAANLQVAVAVQGTLNNPTDTDSGWSVEWAIPARQINALVDAPWPASTPWRMNFLRVQWPHTISDGTYSRQRDAGGELLPAQFSVWTPQYAVDMHRPEHWGYVVFADAPQ